MGGIFVVVDSSLKNIYNVNTIEMFERDRIAVHLEQPFSNIRQIACAYNNSFVILFAPNIVTDVSCNAKIAHVSQSGKLLFEWQTSYDV